LDVGFILVTIFIIPELLLSPELGSRFAGTGKTASANTLDIQGGHLAVLRCQAHQHQHQPQHQPQVCQIRELEEAQMKRPGGLVAPTSQLNNLRNPKV
jgi:hypothetical protein